MNDKKPIEDFELSEKELEEIRNAGMPFKLAKELEKCRIHPKEDETKDDPK